MDPGTVIVILAGIVAVATPVIVMVAGYNTRKTLELRSALNLPEPRPLLYHAISQENDIE